MNTIAVFTKYFGATNHKCARIQTKCFGNSHNKPWVTSFISYDYESGHFERFENAAKNAFSKEWPTKTGEIVCHHETPDGYCFCFSFDEKV